MKRFLTTVGTVAILLGSLALGSPSFAQGKKEDKTAQKKAAPVPDAERCIGQTQDGDRCKRKSGDGSKYCWQHDPNRKGKGKKK